MSAHVAVIDDIGFCWLAAPHPYQNIILRQLVYPNYFSSYLTQTKPNLHQQSRPPRMLTRLLFPPESANSEEQKLCFIFHIIFIIAMSKSYVDFLKISAPKVICVGKNYLKHVVEMGGTEVPKEPMLFIKPWTSVCYNPHSLPLPISNKHRIDHELELGVFIAKGGSNISKEKAMEHVGGYFLALDLTDRDFQKVAKQKGFPWTLAKGQDKFCPVSEFIPLGIDPYKVQLHLRVNGQTRQKDITGNMHFKIDDLISYCSQYISLTEGDLILTGTPEGVGAIKVGDSIEGVASLDGKVLSSLNFKVTQ